MHGFIGLRLQAESVFYTNTPKTIFFQNYILGVLEKQKSLCL